MTETEPYREIRIYRSRGLCDIHGDLLTTEQLTALSLLALSQRDLRNAMSELDSQFGVWIPLRAADPTNPVQESKDA